VIGGDATPRESIAGQCNGCDVLIHGVNTQSAGRLSELATRARPQVLILQREDATSEDELIRRMRAEYRGRFVVGHDLDAF